MLLPVPDYVYTMLPIEKMKTTTFSITPVLFNVGINEKATLAHKLGQNGAQEKNNIDNFKTMAEYCRRFKKLNLDTGSQKNKRKYIKLFLSKILLVSESSVMSQPNVILRDIGSHTNVKEPDAYGNIIERPCLFACK